MPTANVKNATMARRVIRFIRVSLSRKSRRPQTAATRLEDGDARPQDFHLQELVTSRGDTCVRPREVSKSLGNVGQQNVSGTRTGVRCHSCKVIFSMGGEARGLFFNGEMFSVGKAFDAKMSSATDERSAKCARRKSGRLPEGFGEMAWAAVTDACADFDNGEVGFGE